MRDGLEKECLSTRGVSRHRTSHILLLRSRHSRPWCECQAGATRSWRTSGTMYSCPCPCWWMFTLEGGAVYILSMECEGWLKSHAREELVIIMWCGSCEGLSMYTFITVYWWSGDGCTLALQALWQSSCLLIQIFRCSVHLFDHCINISRSLELALQLCNHQPWSTCRVCLSKINAAVKTWLLLRVSWRHPWIFSTSSTREIICHYLQFCTGKLITSSWMSECMYIRVCQNGDLLWHESKPLCSTDTWHMSNTWIAENPP